ncbi:MAG: glycosyltransferase family 2 protein [Planctomycetota bacterium]
MKIVYSYVIPIYNEEEVFPLLQAELIRFLSAFPKPGGVEVVLVDDGSYDHSWDLMKALASQDSRFVAVRLSRNFGHQFALTAGYEHARGEVIICLDADLQDPPEVTLKMIDEWEKGADVVYGVRSIRLGESRFKLWTAELFYWIFSKFSNVEVPRNCGDFRLLSRRALNAFLQFKERHRYLRGLVGWVGFKTTTVSYERQPRAAGQTKYPLVKMLKLGADGIVSMSFTPLRISYVIALLILCITLGYLFYNIVLHFFYEVTMVPGWTSLMLLIMIFGFFNLIALGIMGEYVGRIYEEVKRRPNFIISDVIRDGSAHGEK